MTLVCVCVCVEGLERLQFQLSYNSNLLNVWTGNAAVLAGLTQSAETIIPASLGISITWLLLVSRSDVIPFGVLTLLVGRHEGHPVCKILDGGLLVVMI